MSDVVVFQGLWTTIVEVAIAILPLVVFFVFFQIVYLKLPRAEVVNMVKGVVLTYLGIVFFLQGVHVGFLPTGELLGKGMVDSLGQWWVVPIGFVLGAVATFAEPAVRALSSEVEKVTAGSVPQVLLLFTLSLGVGLSIGIAMVRVIMGISLVYLLLPGYALALAIALFSKDSFTSIAFDSGGVATGPMTVTFIMAFSVGVASQIEGRDPLLEGFGMIALVALIPILTVLALGLIYSRKERQYERDADQ